MSVFPSPALFPIPLFVSNCFCCPIALSFFPNARHSVYALLCVSLIPKCSRSLLDSYPPPPTSEKCLLFCVQQQRLFDCSLPPAFAGKRQSLRRRTQGGEKKTQAHVIFQCKRLNVDVDLEPIDRSMVSQRKVERRYFFLLSFPFDLPPTHPGCTAPNALERSACSHCVLCVFCYGSESPVSVCKPVSFVACLSFAESFPPPATAAALFFTPIHPLFNVRRDRLDTLDSRPSLHADGRGSSLLAPILLTVFLPHDVHVSLFEPEIRASVCPSLPAIRTRLRIGTQSI